MNSGMLGESLEISNLKKKGKMHFTRACKIA
jgi:hypothetical protein